MRRGGGVKFKLIKFKANTLEYLPNTDTITGTEGKQFPSLSHLEDRGGGELSLNKPNLSLKF